MRRALALSSFERNLNTEENNEYTYSDNNENQVFFLLGIAVSTIRTSKYTFVLNAVGNACFMLLAQIL